MIAEIIRDELGKRGQLTTPVRGLSFLAASKVTASLGRSSRPWRMLRTFINHDFLIRIGGLEFGRNLYGSLQDPLSWDYHFWLQRGSLEVEFGDLPLAELALNTARSLAESDTYVRTEWDYLLFRKAVENPNTPEAPDWVKEATASLEYLMSRIGDPYPYHVLGSQGLSWARRGIKSVQERERYLRMLCARMEEGCKKYPKEVGLRKLHDDLRREHLQIAVPKYLG